MVYEHVYDIPDDMLTHLSRIPLNEKDLNNSIKRAAVFLANSRHERDIYHHTDSTAIKYVCNLSLLVVMPECIFHHFKKLLLSNKKLTQ